MNWKQIVGGLWLVISAQACAYGPFYDDTISSTTSPVTFNLFATKAGVSMTAECATHFSGFTQFASKVASSSPTTINGESIYSAFFQQAIPSACWDDSFDRPVTYLQFFQKNSDGSSSNAAVFDSTGATCVGTHINAGEGPISAGYHCKLSGSQVRLFASH